MNWVHPLSLLLGAVVVAFLRSWCDGIRDVLGVQPDLIPALVVYAALNNSLATTTLTAVIGGLAQDALSSGPFGLSVLPLLVVGLFLHQRREVLLRDSAWAQALLGGAAALVSAAGSVGLLLILWPFLSGGTGEPSFLPEPQHGLVALPSLGPGRLWQITVIAAGGVVGTPLVFRIFRWIEKTFHYPPISRPVAVGDREIQRGRY